METKKRMSKGKTLFVFTLVFVVYCLMAASAWAVKKIDLYPANTKVYIEKMNSRGVRGNESMDAIFGLSRDEKFTLARHTTDFNGVTHTRYRQTYRDIPLWGMEIIVSRDHSNQMVGLHGVVVTGLAGDNPDIPGTFDPKSALIRMQNQHKAKEPKADWHFRSGTHGTYIYIDKNEKANLCYVVSFFADTEKGNPSRPIFFIDVKSAKVLESFDMLANAVGTGPGGNLKIGKYQYGLHYPGFGITEAGGVCTLDTANVKTVDLNHLTSGSAAYSYTCFKNTHEPLNGGYCPMNDAHYFGQAIYDMYYNWYGVAVLPFQLVLNVHYGTYYEGAFWDGSTTNYGDGNTTFYPFVGLDVIAHEASHGFTENQSNLIYAGEPGGIHEAFSDMAGEAAKFYIRGTNDFKVHYEIHKSPTGALRYMYNPPLDGESVDHVDNYSPDMDVHYSCGIFNKAFYLIATSPGWTTRMAFNIFVKANMDYWTPITNFQQGAQCALDATLDYGYPCQDVVDAFAAVGITLACPPPPAADFTGTPLTGGAPLTANFTDTSVNTPTTWAWDFGDGIASTVKNPTHTYAVQGVYTVTLTAANAFGADSETKTDYITVLEPLPPVAAFTAGSVTIQVGGNTTFTDQSTNAPTSWSWTFEGGAPPTSTERNPVVTYNTVGTYDVTLVAANAEGSDSETKADYIGVINAYCASQGENQSGEWISRVKVGGLINSSGASQYSDFTSKTATLTRGTPSLVTLTTGYPGYIYTEYWKIWIDYNRDGDFTDTGEAVLGKYGKIYVSGNFTPPFSALPGITRMRVSMKYGGYPTSCLAFTYGEVEDYSANIQ